jgi:protein-tyrosine phosphatase
MYRVTQALSVGRFATPERAEELLAAGVTHILNVSDAPSRLASSEDGFQEVVWVPLDDSSRFPTQLTCQALDALHRMASKPGAHVYVHCIAGHLRSPTVLWLYLIACGIPMEDARAWIEERSPDAAPGTRRIVDAEHIALAQKHGRTNYLPLHRGEIITRVPLSDRRE